MTMMERVESLLINYPETRVNDNLLLDQVWRADLLNTMSQQEFNTLSYRMFSKLLQEGSLSNPKAVTRARRKVQQDKPYLKHKHIANYRAEMAERYRIMGAQGRIGELL
tara:strand:- start:407 stop:733 length:327 start_codon:yes stop_codon:yes gene_type:complete